MKSTLITLLAHETRTPLAHILSSAQLLEDEEILDSVEARSDLLGIILHGAQRLQSIFEKSMLLFRQQSEEVPSAPALIDLGSLVRSEIDRVCNRVAGSNFEFEGETASALADESLLRQAIGILLEQAARRSPRGSSVCVRLSSEDGGTAITICDHGPSPNTESLPHYFALFSVSDIEHHADALDLDRPICASIVRRHGGSIRAILPPSGGLVCQVVLPTPLSAEEVA